MYIGMPFSCMHTPLNNSLSIRLCKLPVSLSLALSSLHNALSSAAVTTSIVRGAGGHARVGVTAHVRSGSRALPVIPGETTAAEHTPSLASAEGRSPSVSVQTGALEAFWVEHKCATYNDRYC